MPRRRSLTQAQLEYLDAFQAWLRDDSIPFIRARHDVTLGRVLSEARVTPRHGAKRRRAEDLEELVAEAERVRRQRERVLARLRKKHGRV